MEASDSEYFESADEDFESDVEEKEETPLPKPEVVNRTCETTPPDLASLKIDVNDNKSKGNTNKCHDKCSKQQKSIIIEDVATEISSPTEAIILDNTQEQIHNNVNTQSITAPAPEESNEENLWDDEELDWGSEAVKELESKESPVGNLIPDETNDEFDVTWGLDNVASKQEPPKDNQWETEWKPIEETKESNQPAWGGWGNWGVSSLLNTATQSVSTITNSLSSVLENNLGIPQPEELAKQQIEKKETKQVTDTTPVGFGLGNLVSGVTKFVETTGTKVISGGLDTLEAIGKKTVEVLQEGDPGLRKKRAFLKLDTKPNLSQILREAKEKSDQETHEIHSERKKLKNYETLFDDHHGLVHLEALEMLSKLCSIKLDNIMNSLVDDALKDLQETLEQVKELCELPDDEDDEKVSLEQAKQTISTSVSEINIPISYGRLFTVCEETNSWLNNIKNLNLIDEIELHQQALETLAQITALAVEQYHKAGELLMVKEHRSTADEADSLVQITATVKSLILVEAEKFTDKLNSIQNVDKDKINGHITNIFYEAGNSGTYIQDAFQLLIPVLQVGAV